MACFDSICRKGVPEAFTSVQQQGATTAGQESLKLELIGSVRLEGKRERQNQVQGFGSESALAAAPRFLAGCPSAALRGQMRGAQLRAVDGKAVAHWNYFPMTTESSAVQP